MRWFLGTFTGPTNPLKFCLTEQARVEHWEWKASLAFIIKVNNTEPHLSDLRISERNTISTLFNFVLIPTLAIFLSML